MKRTSTHIGLLIVLISCLTCAAADPPEEFASRAVVHPGAFSDVKILTAKSLPPQFDLSLSREMPTPGWILAVDSSPSPEVIEQLSSSIWE